jgi:glycosyltransferase involved in cell wall biosynthesis
MLPNNLYGKIFVRLFKFVDGIIFITEMEKENILNLNKTILDKIPYQVSYNCVSDNLIRSIPKINKKFFKAIYLGSIDRSRAPDRIVKIAYHAKKENLPIKFFIFGKESRKSLLNNKKSITVEYLKKAIISNNLADTVFFKGFSKDPESILLDSDILISPDRMNEPWGRDVLESLSAGLIVIASGDDEIFIKNNINGFLIKKWDARKVVKILKKLVNEVDIMKKIRKEAKKTGESLFKMSDYGNKIYSFFTKIS